MKKTDPTDEERKKKEEEERKSRIGHATSREEAIEHTRSLLPEDRRSRAEVHFDKTITLHQINSFNMALSELVKKYPTPYLRKIGSNYVRNGGVLAFASPTSLEINHDSERNGIKAVGKLHKITSYTEDGYSRELIACSQSQEQQMKAVITHEYGHVIFTNIKAEARNSRNVNQSKFQEARNAVRSAFRKARRTGFIKNISSYANTDEDEFFCECFAAREMGENLPDYINNALDKALNLSNMK
ncbi:MAG: hypothetical protein J6Q59_06105 [Paludibacteraceae bacterium]|nr:hypothetical protein [Paludibacteraceae bacterium]